VATTLGYHEIMEIILVTIQHVISCPLAPNAIYHFQSPSNGCNGFWPLSSGEDHFWTSIAIQ